MRPAPPARVREERGRWRDTWARVEVGGGHLEGSAPEALHGGGEPAEGGPQAQAQQRPHRQAVEEEERGAAHPGLAQPGQGGAAWGTWGPRCSRGGSAPPHGLTSVHIITVETGPQAHRNTAK